MMVSTQSDFPDGSLDLNRATVQYLKKRLRVNSTGGQSIIDIVDQLKPLLKPSEFYEFLGIFSEFDPSYDIQQLVIFAQPELKPGCVAGPLPEPGYMQSYE